MFSTSKICLLPYRYIGEGFIFSLSIEGSGQPGSPPMYPAPDGEERGQTKKTEDPLTLRDSLIVALTRFPKIFIKWYFLKRYVLVVW